MDTRLKEQFASALIEVMRSELIGSREIIVPGLGRFRVEHIPSRFEEVPDGTVWMTPPEEIISFEETT